MSEIGRRGLLKVIGSVPLAGFVHAEAEAAPAAAVAETAKAAKPRGKGFVPQFFTEHEYATVRELAAAVLPKDERSGGAVEAGVPEFMDFMMVDPLESPRIRQERQTAMRGGLAWLDFECGDRYGKTFVECTLEERKAALDDIAWPEKARPEHEQGAHFFSAFRDLTASGFWSSRIGIEDLQFQGNTYVAEWNGCPGEVLKRLGLDDA
jgi:hypothetical protein